MNLGKIFQEVLYEERDGGNANALKLWYNVDVFLQNFPDDEEEEGEEEQDTTPPPPPPEEQAPPEETGPPAGDTIARESVEESINESEEEINEEIIKFKSEGVIEVPMGKVDHIQTLLDLLDFVKDFKRKKIFNSVVIEIIATLAGVGERGVDDVINKGDKVLINLDYGLDKQNSIGLRVNKVAGSGAVSLSLKKDNKILAVPFNLNEFNRQLIYFRNAALNKKG